MSDTPFRDITAVIQLAIAPVFLLTAVGTTLSVLAGRLARVVDRGRALEAEAAGGDARILTELGQLERRARFVLWGLSLGTVCGILVCLLIAVAFVGYVLDLELGAVMAALFIGAMAAFTGALVCLLREVFLATASIRLGPGK